MKIWIIEIDDGNKTIETIYLPAEIERDEIVKWMLWRAYKKKEWEEIFEDVKQGATVLVQTYRDDKDTVDIYNTNHTPDISIFKVELSGIGKYGKHGMKLNTGFENNLNDIVVGAFGSDNFEDYDKEFNDNIAKFKAESGQ